MKMLERVGEFGVYQVVVTLLVGVVLALSNHNQALQDWMVQHSSCIHHVQSNITGEGNCSYGGEKMMTHPASSSTSQMTAGSASNSSSSNTSPSDLESSASNRSASNSSSSNTSPSDLENSASNRSASNRDKGECNNESRSSGSSVGVICAGGGSEWMRFAAVHSTTLGSGVGCLVLGYASDVIGRKSCFLIGCLLHAAATCALSQVHHLALFILASCFSSLFGTGTAQCMFVLVVEISGTPRRALATGVAQAAVAANYIGVSLAFVLMPDWRQVCLFFGLTPLVAAGTVVWIPESPLWLLSSGRHNHAEKVLRLMGSVNGKVVPEVTIAEILATYHVNVTERPGGGVSPSRVLCGRPLPRVKSIFNVIIWITSGVSLAAFNPSDPQILEEPLYNSFISFATVAFGISSAGVLANRLGRKPAFVISALSFSVTGVICQHLPLIDIPTIVIEETLLTNICYFTQLFNRSAIMFILILWASELTSTPARGANIGICLFVLSVCAIFSETLTRSGISVQSTALCSNVLGILFALFLPETNLAVLSQTVSESETQKLSSCRKREHTSSNQNYSRELQAFLLADDERFSIYDVSSDEGVVMEENSKL